MSNDPRPELPAATHARALFQAAVDAVRADHLIRSRVVRTGDLLMIGEERIELSRFREVLVVGAGKASAAMAVAIEENLGDRLTGGLVVTKDGHALPTRRTEVLEAAHPIPDERSVEAGRRIVEMVAGKGRNTLVLCLISGGASALMELPEEGITLADLQSTTSQLLKTGAPIEELNSVRACLSKIKAGGLARAAGEATLVCLVLSDVLGNSLDIIGSGPCMPTARDHSRALAIVQERGIASSVPRSVLDLLESPLPQTDLAKPAVKHVILGDIWTAIEAAQREALSRGLHPLILTGWLQGEAREAGGLFGAIARDLPRTHQETGIDCFIAGGETTVTVSGPGKGGRSQELAAAAALQMRGIEGVALLAAGTDGTDGPTDAAGAVVTGDTAGRAISTGHDLAASLRKNNCYPALAAADALLLTGPTNTNVGDLVVTVRGPARDN
jgi:hydroxypyruvate reductase